MVLMSLAGAGVIGLSPITAAAAPGDPGPAEEAASLVAERGHQLEALTEEFNEARETLATQQRAVSAAADQVAAADTQLATLKDQLAGVAKSAYTGGGMTSLSAFMSSDSPEDLLDRVSLLETVAGHHNELLAQVTVARTAAQEARAAADKAAAEAKAQVGAVAAKQAELESQIAAYQQQYNALSAQEQQQADVAHGGASLEAPPPATVAAGSAAAQTVVDTAMAQLGDPYVWAAAGPDSFDCSGLTQFAFAAAGVQLPHSSKMQSTMGRAVSRAELQPGDLVYFYSPVSHIGIYIGGGKMVHASTSGEPVKVGSVDMAGYAGARRVL